MLLLTTEFLLEMGLILYVATIMYAPIFILENTRKVRGKVVWNKEIHILPRLK